MSFIALAALICHAAPTGDFPHCTMGAETIVNVGFIKRFDNASLVMGDSVKFDRCMVELADGAKIYVDKSCRKIFETTLKVQ